MDNHSAGGYLFCIIIYYFIMENLKKMCHTQTKDLLHYLNHKKIQ